MAHEHIHPCLNFKISKRIKRNNFIQLYATHILFHLSNTNRFDFKIGLTGSGKIQGSKPKPLARLVPDSAKARLPR